VLEKTMNDLLALLMTQRSQYNQPTQTLPATMQHQQQQQQQRPVHTSALQAAPSPMIAVVPTHSTETTSSALPKAPSVQSLPTGSGASAVSIQQSTGKTTSLVANQDASMLIRGLDDPHLDPAALLRECLSAQTIALRLPTIVLQDKDAMKRLNESTLDHYQRDGQSKQC
jgi:hypothetical protein